jgi:hypothetical protein
MPAAFFFASLDLEQKPSFMNEHDLIYQRGLVIPVKTGIQKYRRNRNGLLSTWPGCFHALGRL